MNCNLFVHNNFHVSFADIQINGPCRCCRHISSFYWSYARSRVERREYCTRRIKYIYIHTTPREWKEKIKFNSEYHTNRELSKCQFSRKPNYRSILQPQLFFDFISLFQQQCNCWLQKKSLCNVEVKMHNIFFETFLRQKIKARLLGEIFINSWSRVVSQANMRRR